MGVPSRSLRDLAQSGLGRSTESMNAVDSWPRGSGPQITRRVPRAALRQKSSTPSSGGSIVHLSARSTRPRVWSARAASSLVAAKTGSDRAPGTWTDFATLQGQNAAPRSWRQLVGDPTAMLELVRLVQATVIAALGSRRCLVVKYLLLRQQLQVALRSQRRPHVRAQNALAEGKERETTETSRARPRAGWRAPRVRLWLGRLVPRGVDKREARSQGACGPAGAG